MMVGNATETWTIPDMTINKIANLVHGTAMIVRDIFLKKRTADLPICEVAYSVALDGDET